MNINCCLANRTMTLPKMSGFASTAHNWICQKHETFCVQIERGGEWINGRNRHLIKTI